MTRNLEITMNGTSYVQGFGLNDGDRGIAPSQRSTRLNTMASGAESPPWGTTMAAHGKPSTCGEQAAMQ
ncbi:hypothetical protein ACFX15_008989 [Malus domestica]